MYLAHDERLDRDVALAIVVGAGDGPAARARVRREAHVTGRLGDHPNVITAYDAGDVDGVPYFVMRAMAGGSLADAPRPSLAETVRLGGEIAAALAHAHAHGVVHRDVKPDNVWLDSDGRAALGDFGVAYDRDSDRLTADGIIVGTARYLSPEQARGDRVCPRSDLYSLGVTIYELLTGRPLFVGDTSRASSRSTSRPPRWRLRDTSPRYRRSWTRSSSDFSPRHRRSGRSPPPRSSRHFRRSERQEVLSGPRARPHHRRASCRAWSGHRPL